MCVIILKLSTQDNVFYWPPPYQGVCGNRDTRYLAGIQFCEFVAELEELNNKSIKFIISYDGRTGKKMHGKKLPDHLELTHIEIEAGRSSQETLLGRNASTVESLYLSPALIDKIGNNILIAPKQKQLDLMGASL